MQMKWRLPAGHFGVRTAPLNSLFTCLRSLDPKHTWRVSIDIDKPKRSLGQNARFNARLNEFGAFLGYTNAELKQLVKDEMGAYQDAMGSLGVVRRYESSAQWDKNKMAHAMDLLDRWAAENNFTFRTDHDSDN